MMFAKLYAKCMAAAGHENAPKALSVLSFAESSFFPIPPDVMLAPMVIRVPNKALYFAFLCTFFSVLGGVFGYLVGYFAFDLLSEALQNSHYWSHYLQARIWFEQWGVWIILVAGFSPIPYKLFTITAGVMTQSVWLFILFSFLGRGARFFLLAGLLKHFGPKIEPILVRYIEWFGWLLVCLLAIALVIMSST